MDLIRVVAIILVIVYHVANEPYNPLSMTSTQYFAFWWSNAIYLSLATLGVPLFIMLSGALLLQPQKANEPLQVFLKKRLSRIGVAFVFWSIIYFAWGYFFNHTALTVNSVISELLNGGAYKQFWFIYLIMGLYLITPFLRLIVANADRRLLRYLIVLWFVGVTLIPLFHLITGFAVDSNMFLFGGYIGYFVLGTYLIEAKLPTKTTKRLLLVGLATTVAGLYLMCFVFQSLGQYFYFTLYTALGVVVSSVALYMLLSKYPRDWPKTSHPRLKQLTHAISVNTLAIFFLHPIVIEAFNAGVFGFKISLTQIPLALEVPLLTAVSLFVSLGIILLCKKVPVLRTLVG